MNELMILQKCDDDCPLYAGQCPVGPTPNMVCDVKKKHYEKVDNFIKSNFPTAYTDMSMSTSIDMYLAPVYRQLINLYIAEFSYKYAIGTNGKINPIMREIRGALKYLQETEKHLTEKIDNRIHELDSADGMKSGSYYDMLLSEGKTDVNEVDSTDIML